MEQIAIFDDDPELAEVLGEILTEEGLEVLTFSSPPSLQQIKNLPVRACFVDVWFNDEPKGAEFVQSLEKNLASTDEFPSTLYIMSSDHESAYLEASPYVRKFFPKPLDIGDVVSAVQTTK